MRDGYFVSAYELKGVRRYIVTDDLPDMFDVEITYSNQLEYEENFSQPVVDSTPPLKVMLTINRSESKVETLMVKPNLNAVVKQARVYSYVDYTDFFDYGKEKEYTKKLSLEDIDGVSEIEHNITIDRVSISPLGNILVFTEAGSDLFINRGLFGNYFIVDDKGNYYGKIAGVVSTRENNNISESQIVEFYGNVPTDVEYLKLIPYNSSRSYSSYEYADISSFQKKCITVNMAAYQ